MQRLSMNKPMKAAAIYFKGKSMPLRDRLIWVSGNFLIVAQDEEDVKPTWYNIDRIDKLEGVEVEAEPPKTRLEHALFI